MVVITGIVIVPVNRRNRMNNALPLPDEHTFNYDQGDIERINEEIAEELEAAVNQ